MRPTSRCAASVQAWLAGVATNLKPGDALLFVGDEFFASINSDAWDFRLITAVEADAANDRTRVAWARGLGASDPFSSPPAQPRVFAMRKRSAVFGNNAPVWRSMDPRFRSGYAAKFGGSSTAGEWANFTITPSTPSATAGSVDLDQVQSEIAADVPSDITRRSFAVLAKGGFNRPDENFPSGTYVELYRVTGTTEVSRAEFALSAKVTRLGLAGENLDIFFESPRDTSSTPSPS